MTIRKVLTACTVAAAGVSVLPTTAQAADAVTSVTVEATVVDDCVVSSSSLDLNFKEISAWKNHQATIWGNGSTIDYACTAGSEIAIKLDNVALDPLPAKVGRKLQGVDKNNSANSINYKVSVQTLSAGGLTGGGMSDIKFLGVSPLIDPDQIANAPAGLYRDSFTISIGPKL